ncbi:MAG: hypothetical protein JSS99_17505 [Actinobacteria bacterium]|nr:hypothetical protein [Actinomycetota bacterium]
MRPRIALLIAVLAALALPAAASARAGHHPHHPHHVRVAATVTLDQPSGDLTTATPIAFTGTVSPANAGHRVLLQRQASALGDRWVTVDGGFVRADGRYTIVHRFRAPGDRTLRALLQPNRRTLRSPSTPISITVQQLQVAGFTIGSSAQPIDFGGTITISGTLSGGASTSVTLFARDEWRGRLHPIATATTDTNGAYAFTQSPPRNTVYQVRVTTDPHHRTARLFQGVRDVVSIAASTTTANVGDVVTFSGSVQPSKAGHVVLLLRLDGGVWRAVAAARVGVGSTYAIPFTLAAAGSAQYRTLVPGGPLNQRGLSSAVQVTANPSP